MIQVMIPIMQKSIEVVRKAWNCHTISRFGRPDSKFEESLRETGKEFPLSHETFFSDLSELEGNTLSNRASVPRSEPEDHINQWYNNGSLNLDVDRNLINGLQNEAYNFGTDMHAYSLNIFTHCLEFVNNY